jgi:CheY-like chemotaxis protein
MKQILVVDDDRELAQLLAFGLRLRGYLVEVANNGREALAVLDAHTFDAIVVDWNMPVMGGPVFLEEYSRRTSAASVTPIVVMTAERGADARASRLGATAVLAKPFQLDDLEQILVRLLGTAE